MSEKSELEGYCGHVVQAKVWSRGHSFRCARRESSTVRYWKPDRARYWWAHMAKTGVGDLQVELYDFCRTCRHREHKPWEGPA